MGRRNEVIHRILLAKNEVNYNLLLFLSKKYKTMETLLGLLHVLENTKETKDVTHAIRVLEMMG